MRTSVDAPPANTIEEIQAYDPRSINALTVVSIAIVSYLLAVPIIHEGLGHGLTAAVLGAKGIRLTSAVLFYDDQSVSQEKNRIITIAGPVTSLLCGLLLAIFHRYTRLKNAEFRYFVWLTAYVCLFQGGGYLMALSFVHFGDIDRVVAGLDYEFAWRLASTISGAIISFVSLFAAGRDLDEFLGRSRRRARAAKFVVISYFAGSAPLILSGLLNSKAGWLPIVSASASTLGGTVFLLYVILAVGEARPSTNPIPLSPGKSPAWYCAGVVAILLYGLVLGPGVPK